MMKTIKKLTLLLSLSFGMLAPELSASTPLKPSKRVEVTASISNEQAKDWKRDHFTLELEEENLQAQYNAIINTNQALEDEEGKSIAPYEALVEENHTLIDMYKELMRHHAKLLGVYKNFAQHTIKLANIYKTLGTENKNLKKKLQTTMETMNEQMETMHDQREIMIACAKLLELDINKEGK